MATAHQCLKAGNAAIVETDNRLKMKLEIVLPTAGHELPGLITKSISYTFRSMSVKLHTVVETPEFLRRAKSRMGEGDRRDLVDHLAAAPNAGDLMEGTGGARKLRWARPGSGKSGGLRVITFYGGAVLPVFIMTVFAKNEKANITKAERNELAAILSELARTYRKNRKR